MAGAPRVAADGQSAAAQPAHARCEGTRKEGEGELQPEPGQGSPGDERGPEQREHDRQAQEVLQHARQRRLGAALEALERRPALWGARDGEAHSLLHWGALMGNVDFVRCGIAMGCPVDAQAHNGQTPLMWAVLKGHLPVVRALLDAGANPHAKDSQGATSLVLAVQHKCHGCMLVLMRRGGEKLLADRDKNGCTVAHWAAFKGDVQALKLLGYFDVDLRPLDYSKMSPLHRAVRARQHEVVKFLVEEGCDPSQRNAQGASCHDIASQQQDHTMQELLKRRPRSGDSAKKGSTVSPDLESGEPLEDDSDPKKSKKKRFMEKLMKDKQMQKTFPVFWLVCVSLSTFEYLVAIRPVGHAVAPVASFMFELGVPLSLLIFAWTALADPGKLPQQPKGRSGMEELMRALDGGAPEDRLPDVSRLCTTTWVLKSLRTKYCTQTDACVDEFDHYCVWLNTAIGRGNHRQFVALALTEWATQLFFLWLCWNVVWVLVSATSVGGWIFELIFGHPLFVLVVLSHALTVPWVTVLVKTHVKMINDNLTTNEMMNMSRYEHFWTQDTYGIKRFKNPFNKGGWWDNHRDFWWTRKRGLPKREIEAAEEV